MSFPVTVFSSSKFRRVPAMLAGVVVINIGALLACSVPVFRYGLEHWKPDTGQVTIFHRGEVSGEAAVALDALQRAAEGEGERLNVHVVSVDTTAGELASAVADDYRAAGSPAEPWMSVRLPDSKWSGGVVWQGSLTVEHVEAVIQSPARSEMLSRFAAGESAVWVLLECGDATADDAAATRLEERLDYLMEVMELPKLDDEDIRNGLVSVPEDGLRLAFSMLRLRRDDPREAVLVQQLLGTEADLRDRREPIAFPVFGQGRVLYALVGGGIQSENVDRAAAFLIGSCSCEVKEKNPGTDLLITADWKAVVAEGGEALVDLPTAAEIVNLMPETVVIRGAGATTVTEGERSGGFPMVLLMAVAILGVLAWRLFGRTKD